MVDIFTYLDYRKFLRDFLKQEKGEKAHISFRRFARESGIDSGYITRIIAGKRHVSLAVAGKIATACALDKKQNKYFFLLVQFGKAKTQSEKSRYYDRLLTFKTSQAAVLSEKQYGLFDNWYNLAIREMVACFPFRGDYADLGKRISPPISEAKARKSIALLEKLGLIGKNADGIYERIEKVWTTYPDIESIAVNKLQMRMLELARESYDRFPRSRRDMSTLTVSVSGGLAPRCRLPGRERRVCTVSRSPDWVRLCYMNQRFDDKLVTFK